MTFIEIRLNYIEKKFGIHLTGFAFSVILLLISSIYVTPALQCVNHGVLYARLSLNPLDFQQANPLQLRILSPFLGYVLFLRGNSFLFFPLLCGVIFLYVIYVAFRSQSFTLLQSLAIASLMAFNTPILFTLHFQGYTDTLSYLLVLLCLIIPNNLFAASAFALAMLNHESNFFALPYIIFLRFYSNAYRKQGIIFFIIALIPFYIYRHYVTNQTQVLYTAGFYLNSEQIRLNLWAIAKLLPIGIFEAFRLCWGIPLIAGIYFFKDKRHKEMLFIILVPICASLQLCIASDTSRLMGLAFPCILFGAKYLKDYWKEEFTKRVWLVIGFNFLIPVYYVGQKHMIPFFPLPVSIIAYYLLNLDLWALWWK
ncbi:hypothetical protein U14_00795 [Candidatus Moduliflexus flocculans]|uniref:Glycosyltransferase RgtA/B/C/D-like domain-containing protein n=1 Tax=Candidatus Moduliflexus flocculans TaxID=1499966 RepID=A0A0S6VU94_9BACT|nr:hypothetical protein U14_00795 [Candidatus Moduliflexus flocculans]